MSQFYHGEQRHAQRYAHHPEWLLLAYAHARAAGVQCGSVDDFCRRHLSLLPLGDKLTTTAVITAFIWPAHATGAGE